MGQHTNSLSERGDLSTYLAATLLLPLVLAIAFGGLGAFALVHARTVLVEATQQGLLAAELSGGVTAQVQSLVVQDIDADPTLSGTTVTVTGTQPTVGYGLPITISVACALPSALAGVATALGASPTLELQLIGTSSSPP